MASAHYIQNSIIENVIIEKIRETVISERLDEAETLAFFHFLQSRIEEEYGNLKDEISDNNSYEEDSIEAKYFDLIK